MDMSIDETPQLSILIVEDDASLSDALKTSVEGAGYHAQTAPSLQAGVASIRSQPFDIVLCDLRLPDGDGLGFIKTARESAPNCSTVLMTAFGSHDLALQALREGAYDYVAKPFDMEELLFLLRKIEEKKKLELENASLRSAITQRFSFANIVAKSDSMRSIFSTVKRLAAFSTTVLITGESGTGKELLAQALHYNSPRRGKPFVAINCGAIPESLIESELFGHKKGSFTDATRDKRGLLEEASGGTIFLDEIGEMPLHLQVKLLRALQEQQIRRVGDEQLISVDIRVIAATLRDLEEDIKKGRFRDDLFYRLNVVSIHIPPLRDRPEDIPLLVEHFMTKHAKRLGLPTRVFSPEAMQVLMSYSWKGNVRELENCVERALVLSDTDAIDPSVFPEHVRGKTQPALKPQPEGIGSDVLSIKQQTKALEIDLIQRALTRTGGNRTRAAKVLEISHRALLYKLKEYGLGGPHGAETAPAAADHDEEEVA
jgi:two-component system response regulator AtoC